MTDGGKGKPGGPGTGGPIVVINPNSTQRVTDGIDAAMAPLRAGGGVTIDCVTLAEGPPAIESQADAESVVLPLCRAIAGRNDASAFVIACFSDPGLQLAREQSARPVLGIAEAAMLTALTLGERFGVLSVLPASVARHLRYVRAMGLQARFAGDLPIGIGVLGLANEDETLARLTETGTRLRDGQGADVLIMGCAGMAGYREALQDAVRIPVIEPCQAAAAMAIGAARLGWTRQAAAHTGPAA